MTAEEIGKALGSGWEHISERVWAWSPRMCVINFPNGWHVRTDSTAYVCPSAEAAVAVAHLLVAAERIAGGAEVAEEVPSWWSVFRNTAGLTWETREGGFHHFAGGRGACQRCGAAAVDASKPCPSVQERRLVGPWEPAPSEGEAP